MANKKTRNSTKTPEQSISEKVRYHKGYNRTLRKRIENMEVRLYEMEQRLNKYKALLPDPECINWGGPKKADENPTNEREEFLKKHHPKFREDDD